MSLFPWPKNLILDALYNDVDARVVADMSLPPDCVASIEYIIHANLSQAEVQIIHHLYRDGFTVEETAQRHNHSPEGIRLIQSACLDLFRRPMHRRMLRSGLAAVLMDQERKGFSEGYLVGSGQQAPVPQTEEELTLFIGELNLSTRAKNTLIRSGVLTVRDFCSLTRPDIIKLRGCGERVALEIENYLMEHFPNNNALTSTALIANTNLSTRTKNILGRMNIHTVKKLLELSPEELRRLLHARSCGAVARKEILDFITKYKKEEPLHVK